jgi:uncharacterized protein YkwD
MTFVRLLRIAQRVLSGVVVAVLCVCVMSTTGSATLVTKEWTPHPAAKQSLTAPLSVAQAATSASSYEKSTLRRINEVRRAHHLQPLTSASCANRVANKWSAFLARTNGFYHQSMARLLTVCHARYAGETLGMGTITPNKLVSMWMHSPPHRHILLSKSPQRIGIGATKNSRGQWVVAANFMRF